MWKQRLEEVINGVCLKDSMFAIDSCNFFPFGFDNDVVS